MSFASDISKYAQKVGLEVDEAVVAVCTDISMNTIAKTPFDSGRARGNWFATIGSPSDEVNENRRQSQAESDAVSTAKNASGKVFWLSNNLPYIYQLEFMQWSKQAPSGMLRISVMNALNKLRRFQ